MSRSMKTYGTQLVGLMLAVYMLNLSVDSADFEGHFRPEANEIESLVEFVYEIVLDQPNTIAEQDEPDPELSSLVSIHSIVLETSEPVFNRPVTLKKVALISIKQVNYQEPFSPIPTPPPDRFT